MRMTMLAVTLYPLLALPLQAQQPGPQAHTPAAATQQSLPADDIRTIDTIVVSGAQPGPGLWLVRNGSHELYILGMVSPLPSGMQWQSKDVENVIAGAQEVIYPPNVKLGVDVGFFRGLTLLPSMLGARKNPDGKRLQQVVSPASYARWTALKARYIGSDGGIEKMRPLFAAQELYKAALKKSALDNAKSVWPVITAAVEKHHPAVTQTQVKITVTDPKPLIKEFAKTTLADTACFDNTMTRIESELGAMRTRANAWATGDMAALRAAPVANQYQVCMDAVSEAGIGRKLGFRTAQQQANAKWMAAVEAALDKNAVTFAALNLSDLLGEDGFLAKLRAEGYTVLAPDE